MRTLPDLLLQGPQSASTLRQQLGISQATFSRLVVAHDNVFKFGQARTTRYALIRPVRNIRYFPLWQIDEAGKAWDFGVLYPVWPQGSCLVILNNGIVQWFDGLPWYLTDLRPQGFLGRAWGRRVAAQIGLPDDIRLWQEEDVLLALSHQAPENLGGWLIGEESYLRWFNTSSQDAISQEEKLSAYCDLANQALAGEVVGSSAGGEQPKFSCYAQTDAGPAQVIVKFTAAAQNENSQRWSDLLHAEALALSILREANIPATKAQVLTSNQRQTFLEAIRFDCAGARGRKGIVSLQAVQCEFASAPRNWPAVMAELHAQKVIERPVMEQALRIWVFGRLIANSDMHAGNLSFFLSDLPLRLAPVYDMLPMVFAPGSTGNMRHEPAALQVDPQVPRSIWLEMLPFARRYWFALGQSKQISAEFQTIAMQMHQRLNEVERQVERLA